VRIRVGGDSFEMIAACAEGQATYREERLGNPDEALDICVHAERLAPVLSVAGEYVDVTVQKNGRAKFSTGGYNVTVPMFSGEDFPLVSLAGDPIADFDVVGLSALLSSVLFAANAKDIREFCRGVWLESDGSTLTATATNGNILATAQITTAAPAFAFLLLTHATELLIEMGASRLVVTQSHLAAYAGGAELILKPASFKPINWRLALPALKNTISFESAPLREAVSMHRFYGDKVGAVRFSTQGEECELEIMNSDHEAKIDFDALDVRGDEPFNFTFRGDQLAQILSRAPAEKVTFYWDAAKPRAFLVQNGNWRGVVSPLIA
jgi:DNA polymerase III sliding clamp (beta) subunit (PCNA family)